MYRAVAVNLSHITASNAATHAALQRAHTAVALSSDGGAAGLHAIGCGSCGVQVGTWKTLRNDAMDN